MNWKQLLERALVKGENLKDEVADEILKSKVFKDFTKSDIFGKAVTSAIKTKEDVTKAVRDNIKNVLKMMDIPTRNDVTRIEKKISSLEDKVSSTKKAVAKKTTKKKVTTVNKGKRTKKPATRKKTTAKKK